MGFKNKEDQNAYMKNYFKTEYGVLKKLFHHMKERANKKGWVFHMDFDSFENWAYRAGFKMLYLNWRSSGEDKNLKPSVDRIDENGIYQFSNIRLITWKQNWELGQAGEKNISAYTKSFDKHRKSLEYLVIVRKGAYKELHPNFNSIIKKYPFMLKSKISLCCNGKRKTHHSFTFEKVNMEVVAQ